MRKAPPRWVLPFALAAVLMAGCRKERDLPEPDPSVAGQGIVEEARDWFGRAKAGAEGGRELDFNRLELDWDAHQIDRNKAGQPVLTVPVANRFEPGREYMEIAYVADGRSGVGVVKHYVGDLMGGEKGNLKLYDALGRMFLQGRYDPGTGLFSPVPPLATKKSKLNKIASLSSPGNNNSEELWNPNDPIVIDEVTVTAPAPSNGGGGGWGGSGGWTGGDNSGGSGDGGSGLPVYPGGGGYGGSGGGNPYSGYVALAPDVPINLQDRLNCFGQVPSNANTVYKVTLHVNKGKYYFGDVGHTFITLEKSNGGNLQRLSYGFYPKDGLKSTTGQPVTSKMGEDSGRESNIRYIVSINAATFQNAINMSLSKASKNYQLYNYNCTHYALDVFNTVLPVESELSNVSTPNGLYNQLDPMSNSGIHRDKVEKNNLPHSTDCN